MKVKEVVVIGAGIAGCAVALALAKRGVPVTIITSSFDQRLYHAPFIQHEQLEDRVCSLQQASREQKSCSRAMSQLAALARKSVDDLLGSNYSVDRNGNVDIHRCLQEQLKQEPHVEWISNHSLLELLTLHKHSSFKNDIYKKPACIGAMIYHHETGVVETILAKEIVLATGGATSLYPYSTHPALVRGEGLSIAHQAGARLLNMEHIQFHPLGLFEKGRPCYPLPLELLQEGGKLHALQSLPPEHIDLSYYLNDCIYDKLQEYQIENLWLDLTVLDTVALKEKFPSLDAYCLNHGFNIAKDPLPIVPVARYTCGGIAVDRAGQTSLQRLRALGEVACTGLFYGFRDEALSVLESLTWALACAEDIAKQLSKFVYYFPELKANFYTLDSKSEVIKEDWHLLKQIMWFYVGIKRSPARLKKGRLLLEQLQKVYRDLPGPLSLEQIQFSYASYTALLIARAALESCHAYPAPHENFAYSSAP